MLPQGSGLVTTAGNPGAASQNHICYGPPSSIYGPTVHLSHAPTMMTLGPQVSS